MDTLPRLGATRTTFITRLGAPLWSQGTSTLDDLVEQYRSHLGPLTVLFEQDCGVAIQLDYQTPTPHVADLRSKVRQLAAEDEGTPRIFLDDGGWLLVSAACSARGVQRLAWFMMPATRKAALLDAE